MFNNLPNTFPSRRALLFTLLLLALTFAPPPPDGQLSLISPAQAQTNTPVPTNTPIPSATINVDSGCTINQAIASANSNSTPSGSSCEAGAGNDIINISGTHTLTANLTQVNSHITIVGSSSATIDGNNQYALFHAASGANLTVRNLTVTKGRRTYGSAFDIYNGATVTVENSAVHNNTNVSPGLGAFDMVSNTTVTIKNSVVHSNTAAIGNNGGTLTIENSTFYDNNLSPRDTSKVEGIIIFNGTVTLTHVTLSGHYNSLKRNNGTVHLRNSLITGDGTDCSGTLATNAGNLIEDGTCATTGLVTGDPKLGSVTNGVFPLKLGSPAINAASDTHCTSADQRGTTRPQGASCDIGAYEVPAADLTPTATTTNTPTNTHTPSNTPVPSTTPTNTFTPSNTPTGTLQPSNTPGPRAPASTSAPRKTRRPIATSEPPTPIPVVHTGLDFYQRYGIRVSATHGLRSGVQFKRIDANGIGLQSVINNGFIDAVDVFGYVQQGVEVCFPQHGALIFLDAATSPRTVLPWPSTIVDNFTCGHITRPGTLVLVPLFSRLAGPVSTPQPAPKAQIQTNQTGLSDCYVTTTHILNLRASPGGDIIGMVSYDVRLGARAHDSGWYNVTVDGLPGWISADYVRTQGPCA